jgi:hypothetical protein
VTRLPEAATVTTPPAELVQFARAQVGEFAERYRAILRRAFSAHTLVLNGKQLRDLAGGGSQTTAQRAIDEFRAELAAQFSHRVRLGADVPQPLISGATDWKGSSVTVVCLSGKRHFVISLSKLGWATVLAGGRFALRWRVHSPSARCMRITYF